MTLRTQLAASLAFPLAFNLGRSKIWPGDTVHDGISFNAATGKVVVKAPGAAAQQGSLTSLFTFTGGNQSMYVGPNGLLVQSVTNTPRIEYSTGTVGTNILQQSQSIGTSPWGRTNTSVSEDIATAPDGSLTADKLVEDTTSGFHVAFQTISFVAGVAYTMSAYVKDAGRGFAELLMPAAAFTTAVFAFANLSSGVITSTNNVSSSSITNVGNGWYRVSITQTATTTAAANIQLVLSSGPSGTANNYAGDGSSGALFWGVQVEVASAPSQYTRTTSSVPAYTNSTGVVLGLLMEASRTNLAIQSETLDNAAWGVNNVTVSADQTASPSGAVTADKIVETAVSAQHNIAQGITKAASALTYTYSMFVKAAERTFCSLRLGSDTGGTNSVYAIFDLSAGTVGANSSTGVGFTFNSAGIQSYANGWYRVWIVATTDTGTTVAPMFHVKSDSTTSLSYAGVAATGIYAWGAQLEQAAFPSSYIPTTTVAVARTADSCIRTLGAEFSATVGSVIVAGRASPGQDAANAQCVWEFNDGTANNRIVLLRVSAADTARYSMFNTAVQQGPLDATFVNSTNYKAGIRWAANDLAYSFNGAAALTDTTASIPTVTKLEIGSATGGSVQGNCHIRAFDYYPSGLTNAQLAA